MSNHPLKQNLSLSEDARSITEVLPLLLKRIVRLIVGTVSFPALVDILRSVYVEEAQKKLVRSSGKATKSALALVTGLDTRVVSAVLAKDCDTQLEPQQISPELALIDMWTSDKFFADPESGGPATLPIEGKGRTFQGLVLRAIGRNITVKTVLDRLVAAGNVEVLEGGINRVRLLKSVYMPMSNDRAKLTDIAFLESSRVLSTVIHNMDSDPKLRVPQQGRWTYRLRPQDYQEFRTRARNLLEKQIKEGEDLLEEFEAPSREEGQLTVGFGWYQWGGRASSENLEK